MPVQSPQSHRSSTSKSIYPPNFKKRTIYWTPSSFFEAYVRLWKVPFRFIYTFAHQTQPSKTHLLQDARITPSKKNKIKIKNSKRDIYLTCRYHRAPALSHEVRIFSFETQTVWSLLPISNPSLPKHCLRPQLWSLIIERYVSAQSIFLTFSLFGRIPHLAWCARLLYKFDHQFANPAPLGLSGKFSLCGRNQAASWDWLDLAFASSLWFDTLSPISFLFILDFISGSQALRLRRSCSLYLTYRAVVSLHLTWSSALLLDMVSLGPDTFLLVNLQRKLRVSLSLSSFAALAFRWPGPVVSWHVGICRRWVACTIWPHFDQRWI